MKVKICSWNMKGMNLPSKKVLVRNLVTDVKSDVLCIQEVKTSGFDLRVKMIFYWQGVCWATNHE